MAVARYGVEEVLRLAVALRRHSATASVRSRTYPDVILVTPVREVVAALFAGPCVIADLVGRQAGRFGARPGQLEQLSGRIVLQRHECALPHIGSKARVCLDRELVEREMPRAERQRSRQLLVPLLGRLARPGIDQVDADSFEHRLGRLKRLQTLFRTVQTP